MTTYCNRHGDTVTENEALDGAGNLRNGFGLRVPLQMCDSLQRSIAEDAKRRSKTLHRDPMGRELGTSEEEEEEDRVAAASVTLPPASLTVAALPSPPISAWPPPKVSSIIWKVGTKCCASATAMAAPRPTRRGEK